MSAAEGQAAVPLRPRARWPELMAAITVFELTAAIVLDWHFGLEGVVPLVSYYAFWIPTVIAAVAIMMFVTVCQMWRAGIENPSRIIIDRLSATSARRSAEFLVPVLMLPAFLAAHTIFKALLPHFNDYSTDPFLWKLDGIFGIQPWQVTHALFGPIGTAVIDRIYISWFSVNNLFLLSVLVLPKVAHLRAQVLLTFVFSWIIVGSLLAVAIPSVGPCYFGLHYGYDPYAELMEKLYTGAHDHSLAALYTQAKLWNDHVLDMVGFGSGITAMPSMHLAIATLLALYLRRLGFAWLGYLWVAVIWVGSIHLAWHYASDGIVAAVVTILIWKACGWYLDKPSDDPTSFWRRKGILSAPA